MAEWLHGCSATVNECPELVSAAPLVMLLPLLSLAAVALLVQANPQLIPAKGGNTCPGGTSYAGAGYCKVRGNVQYFPATSGNTCPGGSSYTGAGYCKLRQ